MPHAADVFRILVAGEGIWAIAHGYAYAIALELAVLLFVVQRRNLESYIFAGVSILVNLSYYALHGTNLFSVAALPAWLVSIALPAAIARYSHLLVEAPEAAHAVPAKKPATPAGKAQDAATVAVKHNSAAITVSDEIAAPAPPSEAISEVGEPAERAESAEPVKLTPEQRRAHIVEQELTDPAQVAAIFNVGLRTAQQDLAAVRKAATQANGKAVRA